MLHSGTVCTVQQQHTTLLHATPIYILCFIVDRLAAKKLYSQYIQKQRKTLDTNFYFPMLFSIPPHAELKLATRPITTTTPIPYVYTTVKPRRKQHQNHNHKGGHDTSSRVKDILLPNNLQENEIIGVAAGSGSQDGTYIYTNNNSK